MANEWAVPVVHGVGDTGPGVTVDTFLGSLTAGGRRLRPDGRVEVRHFPDTPPAQPKAVPDVSLFPVHIRRAEILPPPGAPAPPPRDEPREVVFAEVYWADLSTIREGTLHLLLSLISTVFFLRFISDQAALMPTRPTTPAGRRELPPADFPKPDERMIERIFNNYWTAPADTAWARTPLVAR